MLSPAGVGLLTLAHEALSTDDDKSHGRLTLWIEELSKEELQQIVDFLLIVVVAIADHPGTDVDRWLRDLGLGVAQECSG